MEDELISHEGSINPESEGVKQTMISLCMGVKADDLIGSRG